MPIKHPSMRLVGGAILWVVACSALVGAKKCALPVANDRLERLGVSPENLGVFETVMLPMRDGVKLHTVAVSPPFSSKKKFPTVIDRSPYGTFNTELLADIYLLFGFAAVSQDMRGTCNSEGNFSIFHADTQDGVDTVNWIVQQDWSDGTVYEIGASADGIAALELARAAPSELKGQFIIFATAEARLTFFPGGTYRQGLIEGWLNGTVHSEWHDLVTEVKTHEAPGPWWDAVEIKGDQFSKVKWPTVMWAGWYDIFQHGNLYTYDGFQKRSDSSVRGSHYLVVDPLGHCQTGAAFFPRNLILGRSLLPVLMGVDLFREGRISKAPEGVDKVTFYVMGSMDAEKDIGNYWTSLPDWPTYKPSRMHLVGGGGLSFSVHDAAASASSTSYLYDPADPMPTTGGNNLILKCGPLDQRVIENRSDVAVFSSNVLTSPLAVTGPLTADLWVSTKNVNDTDFAVRLSTVYPDGTSQLIQDGIERMRWRVSPSQRTPEPMEPGKVYHIMISLWNTSFVFPPGHRVRVTVSSANHPRFSVNPNTGLPLSSESTESIVAHNTIHHSAEYPSGINLPVVTLEQLPKHGVLESAAKMAEALAGELDEPESRGLFEKTLQMMQQQPLARQAGLP